jgi:hypothetical protein
MRVVGHVAFATSTGHIRPWRNAEQHIRAGNWNIAFPKLGTNMTLGTILLIVLILILIGVIPTWPHSSGWGYYPAGGVGTILVIVLILLLLGRL